ncbi:nuclear transport factor 2 family protein [Amycolatopsis sp. H20-H5]|uniref:nuclear transport factor 2 family protein n=1 Tax=Amycolatopsis sp. H20-H5 TaxID=3046309 RepID=UPI002DB8C116|nr:nuclear transport factor 2 family protein [Amycolatopsis sp. H20-H5]MEC3975481.1 nuclear transport factor 2 family protein [Amycolatopsis sp. H20-H5]
MSGAGDLAAQVVWLVDRALIADLLVEFARALDERDWDAYAATYAEDGVFRIGDAAWLEGRSAIRAATVSERGCGAYAGTWQGSSNHAITITGDTATTRSYLHGLHLLGGGSADHADGAGWYDCAVRRTAGGWRFTDVRITEVWHAGEPLRHVTSLDPAQPDAPK